MDRWAVDEDRDGAFLVLPLKNDADKVVGVVGLDTLLSNSPTQFLPHEITFIQVLCWSACVCVCMCVCVCVCVCVYVCVS